MPKEKPQQYRPHSYTPNTIGRCTFPGCGKPADHPNHAESWT